MPMLSYFPTYHPSQLTPSTRDPHEMRPVSFRLGVVPPTLCGTEKVVGGALADGNVPSAPQSTPSLSSVQASFQHAPQAQQPALHVLGSAQVEIGATQVVATVRELSLRDKRRNDPLRVVVRYAGIAEEKKELSHDIEQAISRSLKDPSPDETINVELLILQDAGSVLSASIMAVSLALADTGVSLYDLVVSCTLACDKFSEKNSEKNSETTKSKLTLDPETKGNHTVYAELGETKKVCFFDGDMANCSDNMAECFQVAHQACQKLLTGMKQTLKRANQGGA